MQLRKLLAAMVCCFLVLSAALADRNQTKPADNSKTAAVPGPTLPALEQDMLNEINAVRAHPAAYVAYLEALKPFFNGNEYRNGTLAVMTQEGWSAVEDAIKFLRAAKPQPPLTVSPGLCSASSSCVKEQSATGSTGHKGANNSMVEDRVKPYGTWDGEIGENLSYGNEPARDRILTWLIDDGFASRGHRKRVLSPDYKVIGLACGPHPEYGTMCVADFAGGFSDVKPKPAKPKPTKKPIRHRSHR